MEEMIENSVYRERAGLEHLAGVLFCIVDVELPRYVMTCVVQSSRDEASLWIAGAVIETREGLERLWERTVQVSQLRSFFDKSKPMARHTG